jgi:hypothetical protein
MLTKILSRITADAFGRCAFLNQIIAEMVGCPFGRLRSP